MLVKDMLEDKQGRAEGEPEKVETPPDLPGTSAQVLHECEQCVCGHKRRKLWLSDDEDSVSGPSTPVRRKVK